MSSGRPEVLPTDTPASFAAAVARAAAELRSGQVVALPTETVYGLAANALDPSAVAKIFAIKGRPAHNPIIVHVASNELAISCAQTWPEMAHRLGKAFWPGPLTLVVPKSPAIPDLVTAGGPTVGIRWPQHPFMQAVIRACNFPLAAPSANLSNQLSPTSAQHVIRSLGNRVGLIVDGGDANVGLESTVIDVSGPVPRILRPGMIDSEALSKVLGHPFELAQDDKKDSSQLRSPGLLSRHYCPRAPLRLMSWSTVTELRQRLAHESVPADRIWILSHDHIPTGLGFGQICVIPEDPEAYARALYGELHRCDEAGAELIIVESPPLHPAWAAIRDRLRRAESRAGPEAVTRPTPTHPSATSLT